MTTSLTTAARDDGVHCMTDDGTTGYVIKRQGYQNWSVFDCEHSSWYSNWATLEAAEFYALALHADAIERNKK